HRRSSRTCRAISGRTPWSLGQVHEENESAKTRENSCGNKTRESALASAFCSQKNLRSNNPDGASNFFRSQNCSHSLEVSPRVLQKKHALQRVDRYGCGAPAPPPRRPRPLPAGAAGLGPPDVVGAPARPPRAGGIYPSLLFGGF